MRLNPVRPFQRKRSLRARFSARLLRPGFGLCLGLSVASVLSGCAGTHDFVIKDSVGPLSGPAATSDTTGSLIVYSGWDALDTLDAEHRKHTGYAIFSDQGTMLRRVRNESGSFGTEPQVVKLNPGKYWIEATATNLGSVRVPAVLRAGQTTMVYLDGITEPAIVSTSETNWIRQPNGLALGWRDQDMSPSADPASALK